MNPEKPDESSNPYAAPSERAQGAKGGDRSGYARALPWVASTYFAEGLPFSIVHQVSTELFTAMGASAQIIGLTALYGVPWNLKFLWSPLVDRYGTLRRWVIAIQIALGSVVALLAWPAQRLDLATAARGLLVVAVLGATHDIAVDGFYLRSLGKDDQATLSGLRVGAFRLAMIAGKSGLVVLAGVLSWRASFFTGGAALIALGVVHALALPRETPHARPVAKPPIARFYLEALRAFLARPGARISLALILVYRAGDALMFAMSTPLLNHLGFSLAQRGAINGIAGTAGIASSMAGGVLIGRLGLRRTLAPITLVQGLAILLYVAIAALRPSHLWVGAAVVAEQVFAGLGSAAFMVFLMRRCAPEYRASHFAIVSAVMSIAMTAVGALSGVLLARVGFPAFFGLACVATIPGVVLAFFVPTE